MNVDWQDISAVLIVAAASAYVVRRLWLAGTKKDSPCPGCGVCGSDVRKKKQLVSLEPPAGRSKP